MADVSPALPDVGETVIQLEARTLPTVAFQSAVDVKCNITVPPEASNNGCLSVPSASVISASGVSGSSGRLTFSSPLQATKTTDNNTNRAFCMQCILPQRNKVSIDLRFLIVKIFLIT